MVAGPRNQTKARQLNKLAGFLMFEFAQIVRAWAKSINAYKF
jgi:hypothetical protein